jgi:hypothetical protein
VTQYVIQVFWEPQVVFRVKRDVNIGMDSYVAYTVKPVLRGHLWDKEKLSSKTGDVLREVQFIWVFYDRSRRIWRFNTGDCLIEMTAWTGLTVV